MRFKDDLGFFAFTLAVIMSGSFLVFAWHVGNRLTAIEKQMESSASSEYREDDFKRFDLYVHHEN